MGFGPRGGDSKRHFLGSVMFPKPFIQTWFGLLVLRVRINEGGDEASSKSFIVFFFSLCVCVCVNPDSKLRGFGAESLCMSRIFPQGDWA